MKKKTDKPGFFSVKYIFLGLGILAFVIAFLSGPRVMIDTRLRPVILPEDIEKYVAGSESGFDDIVPGAEKKIFWADKKFGSKRKQLIPYTGSQDPHQHVLAGDILSENSTETLETMIVDFILKKSPAKDR